MNDLIDILCSARHIVVMTGAGASAESGIPTFRDALTGLWATFDPMELATPQAFSRDPELVWGWYEWRRMMALKAQPNPGHHAIAELEAKTARLTLVTQNVDDLHERAGHAEVLHLHGSLHRARCSACESPHVYPPGVPDEPPGGRRLAPPRCNRCGGAMRPGVVWFGETLPADTLARAEDAARQCDVFFSVGTSAVIYPAAELPLLARRSGAVVVQVNPDRTALDASAHHNLRGRAGEVLPRLVRSLSTPSPK